MPNKQSSQFEIEKISNYSKLEELFLKIRSRRKDAGLSQNKVYLYFKDNWNLEGNDRSCIEPIVVLESPRHLEITVLRPLYRGARSIDSNERFDNVIQTYAYRISCYFNYLGFSKKEIESSFALLGSLDSRLKYLKNNIKPAPQISRFLRGEKIFRVPHKGGRVRVKPRNIVY